MRKITPSEKGDDTDVQAMSLKLSSSALAATCGCTCSCCVAGHGSQAGHTRSVAGPMLHQDHQEPELIAVGALERRRALVAEKLLPRARELSAILVEANGAGLLGPGDLEILCVLQPWVHQLQVEENELRLVLTPPRLDSKAP